MKEQQRSGFTVVELLVIIACVALIFALIFLALGTIRCYARQGTMDAIRANIQTSTVIITNIVHVDFDQYPHPTPYRHNLYYFTNSTGPDFLQALSRFLDIHTNLEVVTWTSDVQRQNRDERGWTSRSDYGATVGYSVAFNEKPPVTVFYPATLEETNSPNLKR